MPTYKNNHTSTAYLSNPPLKINAGASVGVNYYIKNLPAYLEKTADTPLVQPWDLLVADGDGKYDVVDWDNIIVYNGGEVVATVSANGDDSNCITLIAGSKEVWDNTNGLFGFIEVLTGESVSVWGSR